MPFTRELLLLGVSHRTAPVEVRETCAVAPERSGDLLRRLKEDAGLDECWLLSTCNRTEVLVATTDTSGSREHLKSALFGGLPGGDGDPVYVHQGTEAVFHLFRVAAGLDSQVLGESQILGQVKDATEKARAAGTLGGTLGPLLQQTLSVGKRVRRETKVGEGTLSVARAAVELASKVLGAFSTVDALVVGAGETGFLVARHLADSGVRSLVFANRTLARAEKAARSFGGRAVPLDDLPSVLSGVNLTVVSVDTSRPIVHAGHLAPERLRRHDRPPIIIDLSMPRAVDPGLDTHPDLLVHDLDDLNAIVAHHHEERRAEVEAAGRILVAEVHKFLALRTYAAFKPVITGLRDRFEEIRAEVLEETGAGGDPGLERLSRRLTRRLLDEVLGQMKKGARLSLSTDDLDRRYRQHLGEP